jgi:hypothetical protein
MQVYSLDVPFEQHKQFRAEPMEKPRRIQAPGLLENVASVSQQGRASTTPHPPLWLREGLTDMKFLGFEGRGPAKNLPPGGDYAEQKAKTGCERESDVRVLLACLMRFLIGISCHVCRAAKLLPGLARHVIRKFAYAFGCLFYGVSCMACIALAAFLKVSVAVVISLPFAPNRICDHNLVWGSNVPRTPSLPRTSEHPILSRVELVSS